MPFDLSTSAGITLADLAAHLGAQLQGDPAATITGVAGIEEAAAGHLTFVANPKYAALARTTRATAVLVEPSFPEIPAATLRIVNPYLAFGRSSSSIGRPSTHRASIPRRPSRRRRALGRTRTSAPMR
jgi:UDP-3-O-[3-hydroxymyristoyl] glucosamine N-acyltransferase